MKNYPLVSIVTVNYRQAQMTCDLLRSLSQVTYPALEVVLVDNGYEEDHHDLFVRHLPGLVLLKSRENLGFAGGTNLGIRQASGKYILLLNNDTVVPPGFLEPLVEVLEQHPDAGMVSPKIYYYDQPDVIQYAGTTPIDPITGRGEKIGHLKKDDGSYDHYGPTHLANGACMLVRRKVFEQVGLLSELYFMYYEEHDLCERARRASWDCYYTGKSHIHHRQSMSMGKYNPRKTYYLFRNRWLFMRRNHQPSHYWIFLVYFFSVAVSKNVLRHLLRRELDHARAIIDGLIWNFKNQKVYHNETINQ